MNLNLPSLKALILDFNSVNHVDITSVQQLIDVRNQLDRYAAPDTVDWHIACINNRWTKRALVSAGFGYPTPEMGGLQRRWQSIFSVAEIGGSQSAAAAAEFEVNEKEFGLAPGIPSRRPSPRPFDTEANPRRVDGRSGDSTPLVMQPGGHGRGDRTPQRNVRAVAVHGLNRPLFHVDLTSAVQSAITNVEARYVYFASLGQDVLLLTLLDRAEVDTDAETTVVGDLSGNNSRVAVRDV